MITPRIHTKKKSGRLALTVTVLSCALLYSGLLFFGFPEAATQPQEVFRQVDFELLPRFAPEPDPEPEIAEDINEEVVEEKIEEVVEEPPPVPAEIPSTPQKVELNLDELTPPGFETEIEPSTPDPTRERRPGDGGNETPQRLALDSGGDIGGIETLEGFETPSVAGSRNRAGSGGSTGNGLKIDISDGGGLGDGNAGIGGVLPGGGDVLGGPKGKSGAEGITTVEVGLQDITSFGDNYANMDFKALVEWMKQNPAELPVAVKQRMQRGNWDEGLLSSRVAITIGDRSFDLLLMCKEDLYEVHIMLVESVAVTYLIDRSFRQQSTQLVTGTVSLGGDQDIQVVSSRMRPASDQRNKEFYSIFLSWWETVKE